MKRQNRTYLLPFAIGFLLIGLGFSLHGQTISVKGFVFSDGERAGLIGVNVLDNKTLKGTATDFDGTFELEIDESALPVNLEFTYTGYTEQVITITQAEPDLRVKMSTDAITLTVAEVTGQRIDEKKKASALTVESLDGIAIKQTAASNFYDGLGALKGVDLTSASIGIKVVNTRGFNSTAPVRIRNWT